MIDKKQDEFLLVHYQGKNKYSSCSPNPKKYVYQHPKDNLVYDPHNEKANRRTGKYDYKYYKVMGKKEGEMIKLTYDEWDKNEDFWLEATDPRLRNK